jgi:tRNA modification GTPase
LEKLCALKDSFREAKERPPKVVFYGAPNAGKSSLINALVAQERLLVSSVAGTTRDFVEVPIVLPGGAAVLVDTAGIAEQAASELDQAAMQKSEQALREADLKILVAPPGDHPQLPEQPDLTVCTKMDLVEVSAISTTLNDRSALRSLSVVEGSISVSSKTGENIEELKNILSQKLFPTLPDEGYWVANKRQLRAIEEACEGAERAILLCEEDEPPVELLAFEMQTVRDALRSVVGEITNEAVLSEIFENFCVGK